MSNSRMNEMIDEPLPAGVRGIAVLFACCGIYLAILAAVMLIRPGVVPMSAGAPLLFGLEIAGSYMFLLGAVAAGAVTWGLLKRNNITRHAAMLIAITGIVMLVPSVSDAAVRANTSGLVWGGLGVIVRVVVAWYLSRGKVADAFRR